VPHQCNIYVLLDSMRKRPAMYIGDNNIFQLDSFLGGYFHAMIQVGADFIETPSFDDFHDWIAHRFGYRESTAGWPRMILAVAAGMNPKKPSWENLKARVTQNDHRKSIKLFYELLDEYRAK